MKNNVTSITEYPMPKTTGIELQVLADMVTTPSFISTAMSRITTDSFTIPMNREAYSALLDMFSSHETIDLATFGVKAGQDICRQIVGSPMSNAAYSLDVFNGHMAALENAHAKVQAYCAAINMLQQCSDPRTTTDELLQIPDELSAGIRKGMSDLSSSKSVGVVMHEVGERIAHEQDNATQGRSSRVPTGFHALDCASHGGFAGGSLIILAARPSVGKTASMLQMARAAASNGYATNVFTLEMSNGQLAERILLSSGEITPEHLYRQMDWDRFDDIASRYLKQPLYLDEKLNDIDGICSRIIMNHSKGWADIVFIDYLSLINGGNNKGLECQRIGELTKRLKQTAKECDIPIVLLCQLNRASASEKREPELYDLRDSGNIEQDADMVLMLEKVQQNGEFLLKMYVRKNRQGKAPICIQLRPNSTYSEFTEINNIQ